MLTFKYPNHVPPGGQFFYVVPETGVTLVSARNKQDLLDQIQRHYRSNAISVPAALDALVQDFICRHVADGFCQGDDEGRPRALARNWTFWTVLNRTRTEVLGNRDRVPQAVADRRVRACMGCPMNSRHLCLTCNGIPAMVQGLLGGRRTVADDFVGVCVQTGWLVSAIVHLAAGEHWKPQTQWPDGCWLKGGSNG